MTTGESSKILAGIGSLILGTIVGIILFMIGMKGLSEHYKDKRIYDGLITGGVLLIVSWILFFVGASFIWVFFIGIPIIIAAFVLAILSVKYVRNCLHALADQSGENMFRTAGTLIWIGALLSIILVGFILIWVGFIIAAVGFFTLKVTPTQPTYNYTPPPPNSQPPPTQPYQAAPASNIKANFCPNCGTTVAPEATFCTHCGKQI
jgi:uncharacterized membrane protein